MISLRIVLNSVKLAVFISVLAFGFGAPGFAEDLSDNATCLDCHEDADRAPPSDSTRPQVHNPAGGFFVEDHDGFSCIECHTYIVDLEHEDTAGDNKVNCTKCHDETQTKE